MTILIIACSERAYHLMNELKQKWEQAEPEFTVVCKVKCSAMPDCPVRESLTELVGEWFERVDAIVFLCAAGIAVRSIAPFLRHKSVDPAVVVVDETGRFSISLLSGHAGGANRLAKQIGSLIGAEPVITTATDRENRFAVDEFARINNLVLTDWKLAKKISVRILAGKKVWIDSELPMEGAMPENLILYENRTPDTDQGQCGILIRISARLPLETQYGQDSEILQLIPRCVAVGIGCRKGAPAEKITRAVDACLKEAEICPEAVFVVASIDLKKKEPGILDFCERRALPFVTYPAETLQNLSGSFSRSEFVKEIAGVDCVCERSAAAAAAGGNLICSKKVYDGVTVALAKREGSITF